MNGAVPKKQKGKCYLEEVCHGCGLFHLKQKAEPRLLKSQERGEEGGRGTSSPTGAPPPLCACESQAHLATLQSHLVKGGEARESAFLATPGDGHAAEGTTLWEARAFHRLCPLAA